MKEFAKLTRERLIVIGGKFVTEPESFRVRVMARAEGFAMVRRPGAMPFVVSEKNLTALVKTIDRAEHG